MAIRVMKEWDPDKSPSDGQQQSMTFPFQVSLQIPVYSCSVAHYRSPRLLHAIYTQMYAFKCIHKQWASDYNSTTI